MKITAKNNCVWVRREVSESEKSGILIPDSAKKKAHTGVIITVGKMVEDKTLAVDDIAIFNQTSGFEIEIEGIVYVVLRGHDIVGTL